MEVINILVLVVVAALFIVATLNLLLKAGKYLDFRIEREKLIIEKMKGIINDDK